MRWHIAVSVAIFVVLVILAQATAMLLMFEEKEEGFIDDILSQQIAHSMQVWRTAPETAFPNTPDMRLYRIAHGAEADGVPPRFRQMPIGNHEFIEGGREFHVAVRADDSARYVLIYDVEEHEDRIKGLKVVLVTSTLPLALVTLLLVFGLSGRLANQLEALAASVQRGGGGHVQRGMERELLAIARALDAADARQAELLARERDFTANLAHELRTPLTGIRTDAELLLALPGLPDAGQRRAARIIDSVDRISRLSSSLLVLAREAVPKLLEPVRLAESISAVWGDVADGKQLALDNAVPADVSVLADPALLELVLRNLLENAVRHSAAGCIGCRVEGAQLEVRDAGPGFTPEELPHVFERFYRGEGGRHGLGLALVRHVCTACGWEVSAANHADGGAVITVDFGASMTSA